MEKICKVIIIFGATFLICNIIGIVLHIPELVTIMNNPTGGGGRSISNIPTILSLLITIIILIILRTKK